MDYSILGSTGLKVSRIGFGGIPIQRLNEDEASMVIETAIDMGVNFFDSARAYTDSERKIGLAIAAKREKVILATKSQGRDYQKMAEEIDISLKELNVDYIDLYQCHNVRTEADYDRVLSPGGALEAIIDAKKAGKIGHIGITSHNIAILIKALHTKQFSTVQVPYNYVECSAEEELLPLARALNVGTIIMKPLAGGAYKRADLALRFLLDSDVTTIIPGMDSIEQLKQNIGLLEGRIPLNQEEKAIIDEEAKALGKSFCRRCDYCKPCPQGLDISFIFTIHGYFCRYNLPDWSRNFYSKLAANVSACKDCGICETRCPYSLPIRKMLKNAHDDLA